MLFKSIQEVPYVNKFPTILTSGRLVEYEGGGDETRSNKWLAEFQQQMFVEINPADAAAAGIENGGFVWVHTSEGKIRVAALVTGRVGQGHGLLALPLRRPVDGRRTSRAATPTACSPM